MPMLDMPLAELRTYTGCSPRPDDFDEYWARALAELDAADPAPEFIPGPIVFPGYECFDLYFNGVRNGRVHCKFIKPAHIEGKAPALMLFHGYSGDCGSWLDKLHWAALGYVVCAMDARGQGGESDDLNPVRGNTLSGQIIRGLSDPDPDNLYFRQVFLDTAMATRIVMGLDYVDETDVSAHGGSQGGGLTIACASLVPQLKKAAAVFPFLCDYKRVWDMDMDERAYSDLRDYFRHFDPTHSREAEIFNKLGYIDLSNLSPRIRATVRMYTGLLDNVCPPSTQFAMFNRITAPKEVILYPDFGHEYLKDHDDKVVQFLLED